MYHAHHSEYLSQGWQQHRQRSKKNNKRNSILTVIKQQKWSRCPYMDKRDCFIKQKISLLSNKICGEHIHTNKKCKSDIFVQCKDHVGIIQCRVERRQVTYAEKHIIKKGIGTD